MLRIERNSTRNVLITGGAGFMGAHLAAHFLANTDARITLFDDLADPGAAQNLAWLSGQAGAGRLKMVHGELRNASRLAQAASSAGEVYHLAHDDGRREYFSTSEGLSAESTLKALEAARHSGRNPVMVCASTGNEFGSTSEGAGPIEAHAPNVSSRDCMRLCPSSSVDRLVQDFAKLHHLPAVALHIDTVTGPRQFGEAQDWVARAAYAILSGCPCSLPGDPSQTHDVLHVSDAVQAILAARAYIGKTAGKKYGVSGGPARWITVEQMIHLIERICHRRARIDGPATSREDAPQPVAEDNSFLTDTCWRARRNLEETVRDIATFWHANQQLIANPPRIQRVPVRPSRARAA